MALLGAFVDSRTHAAVDAGSSASYAHGLPAAPDLVYIHENATTDSTNSVKLCWSADATNVSVSNHGEIITATLQAVAVVFHSLVR